MTMKVTHSDLLRDNLPFQSKAQRQAATVEAAKLLTLTDKETVLIPGFGLYRYDVSSNRTANDFDVLLPSTGVGRLLLVGAGGDGGGIINVASWTDVTGETPAPDMARGTLGKDLAGDGGYSVWIWVDGDTTTADGKWILESTVVNYRPGESKEGRWWRVIASQGIVDTTSDFATAHPGIWDLIFFNDTVRPEWFKWFAGDTTLPNATKCFASSVSGFGIGEGGEGRWKPISGFGPVLAPQAPNTGPTLYLYSATVVGGLGSHTVGFNGLPAGYTSAANWLAVGRYTFTIRVPTAAEVTSAFDVFSIMPSGPAAAFPVLWSTTTSIVGPNREYKIEYRIYDHAGALTDLDATIWVLLR